MSLTFTVTHTSSRSQARVGRIDTPHGPIHTPGFVAVGTNGSLKALDNVTLATLNQELIFCNTYHLMLHPGTKTIARAGGIHTYINRQQPIITDSGGFQVFSLAYGGVANELKGKNRKPTQNAVLRISEEGVLFRSYRDGQKILLTPETSVAAQKDIGADIIIPFDELPPYHIDKTRLVQSLARTHRWEKRSLEAHLADLRQQAMFAVVHGGLDAILRRESAEYLDSLPFDGFAIGGSLGKNTADVVQVLQDTTPYLDPLKPRHLLGIGDIPTITAGIPFGVDTFDSSYPTKIARHGYLLTHDGGYIRIGQRVWRESFQPLEDTCPCHTCRHYTKAYLHHLYKAHEPSFHTLATLHNITVMNAYMSRLREDIKADKI